MVVVTTYKRALATHIHSHDPIIQINLHSLPKMQDPLHIKYVQHSLGTALSTARKPARTETTTDLTIFSKHLTQYICDIRPLHSFILQVHQLIIMVPGLRPLMLTANIQTWMPCIYINVQSARDVYDLLNPNAVERFRVV